MVSFRSFYQSLRLPLGLLPLGGKGTPWPVGDTNLWMGVTLGIMLAGQPLALAQTPKVTLPEATPTPKETVIDQPKLTIGDQGPLVQQLQFYLKELGYFTEEPNGVFGESTAAAVRSLQSRKGLATDGVMNTETWAALTTDYQVNSLDLSAPEGSQADLPAPTPSPKTDPVELASPPTPKPSQAEKELKALGDPNSPDPNSSDPDSPDPNSPAKDSASASDTTDGTSDGASAQETAAKTDSSFPLLRILLGALTLGLGGVCLWQLLRLTQTQNSTTSAEIPSPPREISSGVPRQTLEFVPHAQPPADGAFSREDVTAITYRVKTEPSKTDRSGQDPVHANHENDRAITQPIGSSLARPEVTTSELSWRQPLDKVESLIEELGSNAITQRHQAIWELGQQADGRGIKPLMELLPLADSQEQSLIVAALSEIGVKTCKPMKQVLALSLDSSNPEVRKNAIRDLYRLYETVMQSSQLIKYALNDPDPEVQATAAWALDQMARLNQANIPRHFKPEFQKD